MAVPGQLSSERWMFTLLLVHIVDSITVIIMNLLLGKMKNENILEKFIVQNKTEISRHTSRTTQLTRKIMRHKNIYEWGLAQRK